MTQEIGKITTNYCIFLRIRFTENVWLNMQELAFPGH